MQHDEPLAILLHSGIQQVEDKMLGAQQERWRRDMDDDTRQHTILTVTLEFSIQLNELFFTNNKFR